MHIYIYHNDHECICSIKGIFSVCLIKSATAIDSSYMERLTMILAKIELLHMIF